MRHLFIVNPRSFRTWNDLQQLFIDLENCFPGGRSEEYKTYMSRYPRDAIAAIHRHLAKIPPDETVRVYAIGGDGILFDCLNGMVDFPNAELTAVPYGSSNDFVRAFGEDAAKHFRDIKKLSVAPSCPVDIINCGSNYALNTISFGLQAQGVYSINAMFRNPRFKWTRKKPDLMYKFGVLQAMMSEDVRRQNYSILLDGEDVSGSFADICISNTPCEGGTVITSPYAKPDDGLLDVIFTKGCGLFSIMKGIGDFTSGQYEKNKLFFRRQFKVMEIKSDMPLRAHLDGEAFFAEELRLEVAPARIKFFAPEGIHFKDYSFRAYKAARSNAVNTAKNEADTK